MVLWMGIALDLKLFSYAVKDLKLVLESESIFQHNIYP